MRYRKPSACPGGFSFPGVAPGDTGCVARARKKKGLKDLVALWVELFDEHELLTSAAAIALQAFVAMVALMLLAVAVLGETGHQDVWMNQVAPQIKAKVLPEVYRGLQATVHKVFSSSSVGLIVFASLLAIWEV